MEHDTLEYILKIKKMEKEHFTIQTDRFTKVSGQTTENMVRKDSNSVFMHIIYLLANKLFLNRNRAHIHIQTEIHTKEIGLMTSEMALEPTPMRECGKH